MPARPPASSWVSGGKGGDAKADPKAAAKDDEEDGSWWCQPHSIPEEECSMCSAKAAKEFRAKGDWCDLHDQAKSQCFICDPSLMEKAKARYKAKTGEVMPPPEEEHAREEVTGAPNWSARQTCGGGLSPAAGRGEPESEK